MAQDYTRQSSFADGDVISASLFNDEYNQLVNAFNYSSTSSSSTGHRHDGTAGQGGNIPKIGDLDFLNKIQVDDVNNRWGFWVEVSSVAVEQLRIQDGAVVPVTDNDIDLGTSVLEFKNLYLDGTANVDTLVVDETATITGATTLSSTLGVTGATTLSSTLGVTGATTLSSTLAVTGAATLSSTLALTGAATLSSDLTVAGVTTLNGNTVIGNAATDTVTITADVASNLIPSADSTYTLGDSSNYWSAGYIDALTTTGNVTVGGNLTVTGNATISGNLTFGDADTDTVSFSADVGSNILPDVDNTYDLGSSTKEWRNLYIDGTANIDSLVADTADINGGTVDAAIIGGATPAAITGTTLVANTSLALASGSTVTAILDEDTMVSNSATALATQQSIKAYVDAQVTAQDLDVSSDSGTIAIDLDSETLTFTGGTGIDTAASLNSVTFSIDSSVATLTGTQTLTNKTLTSPVVSGGTIDNAAIGSTTASTGNFSTLSIAGTAITATAAELNYVSGVTSALQTQLDAKAPLASPAFTTSISLDGVSITDILDEDTMTSNSATALATQQSIKAYVDTQVATAGDGDGLAFAIALG